MKRVKVLIVDKDILARRAIVNILQAHPNFEIAGVSGKIEDATKNISLIEPDVVLINIESEHAKVQSILSTLRDQFPSLPVIVLSSKSEAGARKAMQALRMGAVDFITKPKLNSNLLFARNHLKKRLLPIIKAAVSSGDDETVDREDAWGSSIIPTLFRKLSVTEMAPARTVPFDVMVIGGCTGGPQALFKLIPGLPGDFPIPIIVAQHWPTFYSAEFARQLDEVATLDVQEAYEGAELKPGVVWVIPGGHHTEIQRQGGRTVLRVHKGPRERGHRPSTDLLFRSASRMFGRRVLAVMLSGSGEDGLEGTRTVKSAGGQVIVQHPDSTLAPHIPHTIIEAGYADSWHHTEELASQIVSAVQIETDEAPTDLSLPLLESDLSEEVLN